MPWIRIDYTSMKTGRRVGHLAFCSNRREFADLMARYDIRADQISRMEIDGRQWDPRKLDKYF